MNIKIIKICLHSFLYMVLKLQQMQKIGSANNLGAVSGNCCVLCLALRVLWVPDSFCLHSGLPLKLLLAENHWAFSYKSKRFLSVLPSPFLLFFIPRLPLSVPLPSSFFISSFSCSLLSHLLILAIQNIVYPA